MDFRPFPTIASNFIAKLYFLFACPIKSRTVRQSFPGLKRNPRPSCCKNTVALSVGISTPSLYKSTTKIKFIFPLNKSVFASFRISSALFEDNEMDGIPLSLKYFAM